MKDKKTKKETLPDLSKITDKSLKATLQRISEQMATEDIATQAKDLAEQLRNEIAPGGEFPPEQTLMPYCPIPTDMCRVSPFFPLRQRDLKDRPYIEEMVITSSSWGEIQFSGPQLSIYEEDPLMAVLALIESAKNRKLTKVEGKSTYTYLGPLLPVLKLMGYTKFGTTDYKRILHSLRLMMSAAITLVVYNRTTRGKRKIKKWVMTNMLSAVRWDDENKELLVTVNPYFYECFINGSLTLISVLKRSRLKSPIAKALYRFIQSHREPVWSGRLLTLATALNLDLNLPLKKLREYIRKAIRELVNNKILTKESRFLPKQKDIVKLVRHPDTSSPYNKPKVLEKK